MVVFCRIEFVQRGNLRDDGFLPQASFIEFSDELFGDGFLLLVVVEDGGTVLCARIHTLPVQCRWVVDREENLQDFPVRNLGRIEGHLDRFRMAGLTCADLLVGRVDGCAACVAGNYALDAVNLPEDRLDTPETTAGESRNFRWGTLVQSCPSGTNFSAKPFIQYRLPVGGGPSSKTWPRWELHRAQSTSVRTIPRLLSGCSTTFSGEIGS